MNTGIPSTNNFWVIIFISGVIMIFFGLKALDKNNIEATKHLKEIDISIYKKGKLKEKLTNAMILLDSANKELNKPKLSKFDLDQIGKLQIESEKLVDYHSKQSEVLDDIYEIQKINYDTDSKYKNFLKNKYFAGIIVGCFLAYIGLVKLMNNQRLRDKILFSNYADKNRYDNECQSCGMILKNDIKYKFDSDYCTHCFNEGEFVDKEMTIVEMKSQITKQLKKKGFSENQINNKLSKLKRWTKKFDWNNNYT